MTSDAHPGPTTPVRRGLTAPELVAAVPAMLGFHPANSLVLVGSRAEPRPAVECTLRIDLPGAPAGPRRSCDQPRVPPEGELDRLTAEVTRLLAARHCDGLLVVVVDDRPGLGSDPPHAELVRRLGLACAGSGVHVWAALHLSRITAGQSWRCYCPLGCLGRLPDPDCSPVAAESVLAGRITYRDREERRAVIAPVARSVLRRRAALLRRAAPAGRGPGRPEPAVATGVDRAGFRAAALAELQGWIGRSTTARPEPTDDETVRLCLALADPVVRDAAFGFAGSAPDGAAERLWSALLAGSPAPWSAEPAVLLAHAALVAGDGVLAGMALRRVRETVPEHPLGGMLLAALDAGCDPEEVLAWITEGAQRATGLITDPGDPR